MASAPRDYEEWFACLNAAEARYLVVGAYAVGFHAEPRFTRDLDIWIEPSPENAQRVVAALQSFGFEGLGVGAEDLARADTVVQIGQAPLRIDLLTFVTGLEFRPCWQRRVDGRFGAQTVHFLAKEDLIQGKKALGRAQDLLDVDRLTGGSD